MKVVTILGTRPEIIRLSTLIPKLDGLCDHVLVHTGQNWDPRLSDLFFESLGVRQPEHSLGVQASSFGEQIGLILAGAERVLREEQPDRLLILGDTNSGLGAIVAKRLGIPVFHMEAGNRCYDDRVPEEVNRRIVDHSSDVLLPYTERSRQNLLREGIDGQRIYVTGNPIFEVLEHYAEPIGRSSVLDQLQLDGGRFFLVTLHRAENVDVESRLRDVASALDRLQREYRIPVVVSTHPRTAKRLEEFDLEVANPDIRLLPPFDFFDFVMLEKQAFCTLSDSGTVQEECTILGVPTVTLRDVTERPETLECGANLLSGTAPDQIVSAVRIATAAQGRWEPPPEYVKRNVSDTVAKIVASYYHTCR